MPEAPIPFGNQQASGLEELAGSTVVAFNVVTLPDGTITRRPGLVSWSSAVINSQGISGLHETVGGTVYAVAGRTPGRSFYRVTPTGSVSLTSAPAQYLDGLLRPTFAETESILVIAGGGEPEKLILSTSVPSRLGGGPPVASHTIANSSRILLNDLVTFKNSVNFSAPSSGSDYSGFETWNAGGNSDSGLFQAEGRPDGVTALADAMNEVFVFGPTSLQTYTSDPTFVYSQVVGNEYGAGAPYSIVRVDDTFLWLDQRRRFVLSDGRQTAPISDPIQRTLDAMTTVSDCFGYRVKVGPCDLVFWTFPTDTRTFVYQKGFGWAQWAQYESNWTPFPVTAKTDLKTEGGVLVGTSDGRLAKLTFGATDFGTPIRAYIETGHLNRGTDSLKTCRAVRVTLRRGVTAEANGEPRALISWRDDLGAWGEPLELGFGSPADQEAVVTFYGLGSYRRRQWRFEFDGAADLILASVTEEFTVNGA
jgi:hypothetical protein